MDLTLRPAARRPITTPPEEGRGRNYLELCRRAKKISLAYYGKIHVYAQGDYYIAISPDKMRSGWRLVAIYENGKKINYGSK